MRTWNKTKSYDSESKSAKNIVTEEDAVTRRRLAEVNISNVYVVGGIVTIINAGENKFNKSVGQM